MTDTIRPSPTLPPSVPDAGPVVAGRTVKEWAALATLVLGVGGGGGLGLAKMLEPQGYEVLRSRVEELRVVAATGEAIRTRITRLESSSVEIKAALTRIEALVMRALTTPHRRQD